MCLCSGPAVHRVRRERRLSAASCRSRLEVGMGRLSGVGLLVKAGPANLEAAAEAGPRGLPLEPPPGLRRAAPAAAEAAARVRISSGTGSGRLRAGDWRWLAPGLGAAVRSRWCFLPWLVATGAGEAGLLPRGWRAEVISVSLCEPEPPAVAPRPPLDAAEEVAELPGCLRRWCLA